MSSWGNLQAARIRLSVQVNIIFYFEQEYYKFIKEGGLFWKYVFTRFATEDFPKGVLKISHVVLGPILLKKN